MNQTPKKKKKLPKDIASRSSHELMEMVFGKRAMKVIDSEIAKLSEIKPKPNIKKG